LHIQYYTTKILRCNTKNVIIFILEQMTNIITVSTSKQFYLKEKTGYNSYPDF
jgi:hypothetical protein